MAITRIKNSSIANRTPKYNDFLAGLPFRPVIGTATDGGNGTSVSVAFTGNNPAGAGITYTALSSPGSLTATGTTSPITVTGLTAGTAYTFQVKAGNSLGDSAYSGSSNSITPVTPTAFESIASATGTGSSGTIDFTSIPDTYQHLQIRIMARSSAGTPAAQVPVNLRLGATSIDTGNNYASHRLGTQGIAADAGGNTSQSLIGLSTAAANNASLANTMGTAIIDIHDYASTTKNKTVRAFCGVDFNNTSGSYGGVYLFSGLWMSTSKIGQIRLYLSTGNFTTTSTFALYGIKGA